MRILCLEDDPAWAELLSEKLEDSLKLDIDLRRVDREETFRKGLVENGAIDLILADYSLPGFDGMTALKIAHELAPDLPFIFVSGSLGEELAIESLKNGATDYLVKGSLHRLGPVVTRALREAREARVRRATEQKIAEQAHLLDLASDAIIVCDLDETIQFWNEGARQVFGWSSEESSGQKFEEFLKADAVAIVEAKSALERDGKWAGEMRCRSRIGDDLTINQRMTLVRNLAGDPRSILIIGTDVTERKNLEAQFLRAQRLEGVGLLASGIAHDLNNILAPILMAAPLLKTVVENPEDQELLSTIETSAQRGAGMVKQILSFTRGAQGGRTTMDLRLLLKEIARLARETFPRSIAIQTNIPNGLWTIRGDTTQLHQVFLNLCINARDALPKGGSIRLSAENIALRPEEIGAEKSSETAPFVHVAIADSGEGIPEEIRDRIFEPFFTTKEADKGTGLGLASVKNILTAHGGFLRLRSVVGSGTCFELFFPSAETPVVVQAVNGAGRSPKGNGELVLVVDDEAQIREVSRRILELNGYRVETAGDGVEAIAAFARQRDSIRVLITDTDMPKMDGKSLIRVLLRMRPDLGVVASGGKLTPEEREAFRALSVREFLDKPYQPDRLLAATHDVMRAVSDSITV